MPHHKLYSEFMSIVKYEIYIRSEFWKFHVHTKNIKDLISKSESIQPDIFSKKQNNLIENSIYQVKPFNFQSCKFMGTHNRYSVTGKYMISGVETLEDFAIFY